MTPWHGVYLDWQLVFIWINIQHRKKIRSNEGGVAIRSMHRSALTWRTWVNIGHLEEMLKCLSSRCGCFQSFFLESGLWYTLILKGSQRVGSVFSRSRAHQLANLMANLCQSKTRVKWPAKSKYSPSFGWHLGDCSHSAHWYALYYVLLTCSQWHSPALAPLR